MNEEDFKEMLVEALKEFSLSVSTEVEYGYDYGDTAYVRVKLLSPTGEVVMEDYGTINLPREYQP